MANEVPKAVFLAGSTAELISALTCLAGLGISDAVVFVERNISYGTVTMDPLLAAARSRFPTVRFVELEIKRPAPEEVPRKKEWSSFIKRWQAARSIRSQWDAACRAHFGMGLKSFGARLQAVYFTALHDYVLVFLAACHAESRVFYPHGFDNPRRQDATDYAYVVRRRSVRTVIGTFTQQKKHFCPGGLVLGALGHLLPGATTVCLPFTGVDRVLTFRTGIDYVPNEVVKVPGLAETFQWLLQLPPWGDLLRDRESRAGGSSLLLLLPECDRHPIWEKNRNYGLAHLRLLQTMSQATDLKRVVIKAHVRSDGSAAEWLARFLREQEKAWEIEILPPALHGIPVEALALTGEFAAACSLGSCSLPPGLGFGIPHYVSPAAAALFDEGWQEAPFWVKYADGDRMLIEEGICRDIDRELNKPAGARCSAR